MSQQFIESNETEALGFVLKNLSFSK